MDKSYAARMPVIIAHYRAPEKLERCLAHLRAQDNPQVEIFVRDNSEDNIYFTGAVNEGLRKYCYERDVRYVVILNQDAYLAPDALSVLAQFLDATPESGIACPLQLSADGQVTWGGSMQAFPYGVHRCDSLESYRAPQETAWANGAALMVRTEVVREVGLWDRNLRFICSDADFSFSARARGWKVHLVPAARCEHSLSGSSTNSNPDLDLIKLRDALYFARKWVSGEVYRSLAHEGPGLTRIGVRNEIEAMERAVAQLERVKLGGNR